MTVIYPVSLLEFLEGSELERFFQGKNQLQTGDLLEGKVIKLFHQGEALIDFGSFRARAHVELPLKEGELLKVTVVEVGEKVHFQIQNPEKAVSVQVRELSGFLERNQWIDPAKTAAFIDRVAEKISAGTEGLSTASSAATNPEAGIPAPAATGPNAIQEMQPILVTLSNLKNLLKPVDVDQAPEQLTAKISSLVKSSGFFWENKVLTLALPQAAENDAQKTGEPPDWGLFRQRIDALGKEDIRALMNVLVRQLKGLEASKQSSPDPTEPARLATTRAEIEVFLEAVVGQNRQILDEMLQKQENQAVFSFTLPFEQARLSGKMKLYLNKKGRGKKQNAGWRISLLLDLSRIGGVRVDLYYLSQVLRLTVFVGDRVTQSEILEFSPMLLERLKEYIESVQLEVLVSKAKIDHFEAEDWVGEYRADNANVDIKV